MREIKEEKKNRKNRYTVQAIKNAFLETEKKKMFNEISVAEICRYAQVSRSTFYQYYNNLTELLDEILLDISEQCSDAITVHKLLENADEKPEKEPFCEFVRREKKYRGLFMDESLTSKIIDGMIFNFCNRESDKVIKKMSTSSDEILTYSYFQMNGCLSVIRKTIGQTEKEWKETRQTLDQIVARSLQMLKQ